MLKELINPKDTVILAIDIQFDFCSPKGSMAKKLNQDVQPLVRMAEKAKKFLTIAREKGYKIIFTRMIEDVKKMPKNAQLVKKSQNTLYVLGSCCIPGTQGFGYFKVKPKKDIELTKNSYNAFTNPELEKNLKRLKAKNLILLGAYSPFCIDSTLRTAFDKGYNVIVPEDLVAMTKDRWHLHQASLEIWKTLFAHVVKSEQIIGEY